MPSDQPRHLSRLSTLDPPLMQHSQVSHWLGKLQAPYRLQPLHSPLLLMRASLPQPQRLHHLPLLHHQPLHSPLQPQLPPFQPLSEVLCSSDQHRLPLAQLPQQ